MEQAIAEIENIYQRAFADLGRQPFDRFRDFMRVTPELIRLGGLRSVSGLVSRHIADPNLRVVFSFHPLFIGGNPFRASAICSIVTVLERLGGVHFAMGGMYAIVDSMKRLLTGLGAEIRCSSEVTGIVTAAGNVTGVIPNDSEHLPADVVVANSDAPSTLLNLLDSRDRSRIWTRRWSRVRYSMSCYLSYFGISREYPELRHHTILMPKNFRAVVNGIFNGRMMPDDLPLYIPTPTRTDPSLAPNGSESAYVLVPVLNLSGPIDWDATGFTLRQRVLNILEQDLGLDGFSRAIQVEHRFTPLDFERKLGSRLGAAFSLEPTLMQSAWVRLRNRSREVGGLYFVGAGTHPGAGIPDVLLSAEIVSRLVALDLASSL